LTFNSQLLPILTENSILCMPSGLARSLPLSHAVGKQRVENLPH
jgi:hypothetical protein